jgi:hypothetical protein
MATAVNAILLEQLQNVMLVNPGSQTRTLAAGRKTKCKDEVCFNSQY